MENFLSKETENKEFRLCRSHRSLSLFFLNNTLKLEKAFSDHGSYKNKPGDSDLARRLQCAEPWFRIQTLEPNSWAQIQSPTLTNIETLGQVLYFSKPQFSYLENGDNKCTYPMRWLGNSMKYCVTPSSCLVQGLGYVLLFV